MWFRMVATLPSDNLKARVENTAQAWFHPPWWPVMWIRWLGLIESIITTIVPLFGHCQCHKFHKCHPRLQCQGEATVCPKRQTQAKRSLRAVFSDPQYCECPLRAEETMSDYETLTTVYQALIWLSQTNMSVLWMMCLFEIADRINSDDDPQYSSRSYQMPSQISPITMSKLYYVS